MVLITKLISYCFPWEANTKYTALSKKDEDFGIEEAKKWVHAYPIDEIEKNIKYSNLENINNYANEVIKSLKKIPITSLNLEIIDSHLDEMARTSELVGRALLKRALQMKNGDKRSINTLRNTLSSASVSSRVSRTGELRIKRN